MNLNPPTRTSWDPETIRTSDDPEADMSAPMLLNVGRSAWESFVMLFGDVADLAAGPGVVRRDARLLQEWIAALERIVRCLLLMMAFELGLPRNPGPMPPLRVLQTRAVSPVASDGDEVDDDAPADDAERDLDPGAWRVFVPVITMRPDMIDVADDWVWTPPRPRVREVGPPGDVASDLSGELWSTFGVARRAEAVLRVLNDPEPYARRLALHLSRLWAPLEFPPTPHVRYLKPASIDHDPEPAPPPRPGPYDHWLKPARERCEQLAAAYWSDG